MLYLSLWFALPRERFEPALAVVVALVVAARRCVFPRQRRGGSRESRGAQRTRAWRRQSLLVLLDVICLQLNGVSLKCL